MGALEEMAAFGPDALLQEGEASDPDYVVVRGAAELERMCEEIAGEREHPIIGLTLRSDSEEPVLRAQDVRRVVGPGVRIYLIASEELLHGLRELLGARMRVWSGAIRIWWPGAGSGADPGDHPLVVGLEDEDYEVTLEELAYEFDLSRPRVRSRVRLIEDARAFLQRELVQARAQCRQLHDSLRDSQLECHRLRTRAEAAETGLAARAERAPAPE